MGPPGQISLKIRVGEVYVEERSAVYEKAKSDIIAGIGLVCGVGIMFVGVVARYIFHHPRHLWMK